MVLADRVGLDVSFSLDHSTEEMVELWSMTGVRSHE